MADITETLMGPFLIHEGEQNQTAHAQYRYKSNDIIMTYSCIHYTPPLQKLKSTPISIYTQHITHNNNIKNLQK